MLGTDDDFTLTNYNLESTKKEFNSLKFFKTKNKF